MPNLPKKATKRPWIPERPAFENKPVVKSEIDYTSAKWRRFRKLCMGLQFEGQKEAAKQRLAYIDYLIWEAGKKPFCKNWEKNECSGIGNIADHIRPVNKQGDVYDKRNIQILCESCHNRKSRYDAR